MWLQLTLWFGDITSLFGQHCKLIFPDCEHPSRHMFRLFPMEPPSSGPHLTLRLLGSALWLWIRIPARLFFLRFMGMPAQPECAVLWVTTVGYYVRKPLSIISLSPHGVCSGELTFSRVSSASSLTGLCWHDHWGAIVLRDQDNVVISHNMELHCQAQCLNSTLQRKQR